MNNRLFIIIAVPLGVILYFIGFLGDAIIGTIIMSIGGLLVFIPLLSFSKKKLEKRLFKVIYLFTIFIISIILIMLTITIYLLF